MAGLLLCEEEQPGKLKGVREGERKMKEESSPADVFVATSTVSILGLIYVFMFHVEAQGNYAVWGRALHHGHASALQPAVDEPEFSAKTYGPVLAGLYCNGCFSGP